MSKKELVVALDGPSGSGKSTIAKQVAKRMHYTYIDTGAMFRALGITAKKQNIPFEEGEKLNNFLQNIDLKYGISDDVLITVDGVDLTKEIREHYVSELASTISKLPSVRKYLLNFQRNLARSNFVVMEGRDIGTVVFPNSFCKIFMTASYEVRAERRLLQLQEAGNHEITLEQVIADIKERDERDSSRAIAPLKIADDAIMLDTSDLTFDQVLEKIVNIVKERVSVLDL